jgi:methionine-rich copper-binding protein CopC
MGPIHSLPDKSLVADFKGKLSNGQYVVNWQTAGDDGHVSKGQFSFTVKSGL